MVRKRIEESLNAYEFIVHGEMKWLKTALYVEIEKITFRKPGDWLGRTDMSGLVHIRSCTVLVYVPVNVWDRCIYS